MVSKLALTVFPSLAPSSSPYNFSDIQKLSQSSKAFAKLPTQVSFAKTSKFRGLRLCHTTRLNHVSPKRLSLSSCFSDPKEDSQRNNVQVKKTGFDWQILKRWDVPWDSKTVSLITIACELSYWLTGLLINTAATRYLGIQIAELTLEEEAGLLLVANAIATAAALGVLNGLTNTFQPLPDDIFSYDWREPFHPQKGWLLWAGIGLVGVVSTFLIIGAAMYLFCKTPPSRRETDAIVALLPFIGSSPLSTACSAGIAGVLAPLLEETVFRGFYMVSLSKWVPTPVAVLISALLFALLHNNPGMSPLYFVAGTVLGFSYAQTRNLLTPITMHALWNSGGLLLLTLLKLHRYTSGEG